MYYITRTSKFLAPPQFVQEGQRNYEAVEGQSVTLVCPVEASPYPEISWMHGTDPIESDNAHFSTDNKVEGNLSWPRWH